MSSTKREQALQAYQRAGRESSRLSVMFRLAIANRMGLTVTDAECLDFLMDTGSATAGELARQTNLTTGAISGMIRRLESAGFVVSERDPSDRRRVIVTLILERLKPGAALYEEFLEQGERAMADYSTDQLNFLAQHYERMSAVYLNQLDKLRTTAPSPNRS
jgi:MarR family transcriptional regulator, organic hydroperoxide resistance regulator